MKTLNEQYQLIKEGKGHKTMFLNEAKHQFPNYVRNAATFEEASLILKQKGIINENIIGITPVNTIESKKESFELAFESFLAEAKAQEEADKAEIKKPAKQVEEKEEKTSKPTDKKEDKTFDNMIFDQIMTGYYAEMKDPKNADKTMEQLKDIVLKNLQKDPIHYVKDGQFGVKGVGYETEVPGLGTPKEPKGKYKSSGYGDLNESKLTLSGTDKAIKMLKSELKTNKVEFETEGNKVIVDDSPKTKMAIKMVKERTGMQSLKLNESILAEDKLRKAIREIISKELEEMINIRPSKSGGGGRRFIPTDYTISALAINRINTLGENSLGWGKPHIIIGDDGKVKISALLYKDLENQERGRTSRDKESAKSPLGRTIGEMDQQSKDALRVIRKNIIPSIGKDKYFESIIPKNTTTLTKTDRETGEKREVLGSITVDAKTDIEEFLLRESVEKDLADINKEAEHEVLQSKLDKIDVLIDKRRSQLGKLDEDEDMKALTDKKKVKELEKDIKKLEVARTKVEKILNKTKGKKKEIIDEAGEDDTNPKLIKAVAQAEEMYNGGLDMKDILVKFNPRMRDYIESRLMN
jgi:hypothetical protein